MRPNTLMRPNTRSLPRAAEERPGERGATIVMAAIGMVAMILAAGLAVDISHFYTAKAELQTAADAAALAGTSQLNSTSGGIKSAVTEATKALNKYDFKNPVTVTAASVTFAKNINGPYMDSAAAQASPGGVRFVKVTLPPAAGRRHLLADGHRQQGRHDGEGDRRPLGRPLDEQVLHGLHLRRDGG